MRIDTEFFVKKAREQERWRLRQALNLLPSENVTSPTVRSMLSSDFGHRYTLVMNSMYDGEFVENSYRGSRIASEVELATQALACQVFSSRFASVQPLSGHIAAMISIKALCNPGDLIMSIPVRHGGYDGYSERHIPDLFGLRAMELPFDKEQYNLATDSAVNLIREIRPTLVILGASFMLFPYDIPPIREACTDAGARLTYDGSHVLGLIAGGEFQHPLRDGVDILYGSTHKSFFGPQGGLILTNDAGMYESIRDNLTWRLMDNAHWNRIAALGQSLLEMRRHGLRYAQQVISNSRRLGEELSLRGFPLRFSALGFTRSHQLLIDKGGVRRLYGLSMNDLSIRLEKSNIIIDSVGRLGTSEITRMGFKETAMSEIADVIVSAVTGKDVKGQVAALRRDTEMDYLL